MTSSQPSIPKPIEKLAQMVRKQLLWMLVACYFLACFFPQAGNWLRNAELNFPGITGSSAPMPMMMLATLLFCAAIMVDVRQLRSVVRKPLLLLIAVLGSWAALAGLVMLLGQVVPMLMSPEMSTGLLVGAALVAAMPVANSSAGWAHNSGGNMAFSLGLIVCSIVLCPLITPHLLKLQLLTLLGLTMSPVETLHCEALVTQFSSTFFIVWVLLPTAAGLLCRWWLVGKDDRRIRSPVLLINAAALLLLNYANASSALPQLRQQETIASLFGITILIALVICLTGIAVAAGFAKLFRLKDDIHTSLSLGLSMKHTGLALVLAGNVLESHHLGVLLIIVTTLVQHMVAAISDRLRSRRLPEKIATKTV